MSDQHTSGSYRIELLKADNWMPWKRRMLAVLRDQGLEDYIEKTTEPRRPAIPTEPTKEESDAIIRWKAGDAKARTRIELSIGDSEMIHLSGAVTARDMWNQLCMVKESRGRLGVLATRRALYRATADEGVDMVEHISKLRGLQNELHTMENLVTDEDFVMILITSLPESWDNYTGSFLGSSGNKPTILSHELIAVLLEEDRRRKGRSDGTSTALYSKGKEKQGATKDKECYNCKKKGHFSADCWAKGGGKEGQGPKGRKGGKKNRANQAEDVNSSLNDVCYMASNSREISKYDWLLDSATTSHVCPIREAFVEFRPVEETLNGVGKGTPVTGRGTIKLKFEFDGKTFLHQLREVLYVPEAPNGLISVSKIDKEGGSVKFKSGISWILDAKEKVVGKGYKHDRLYMQYARAILPKTEKANYASTEKLTWDQWHRRYGHISISAIQTLERENMVEGLTIDQSSIPSKTCDACIAAKQTHRQFPQEAENRSKIPGERFMADVWGPARVKSIGGWIYYVSFADDNTRHISTLFLQNKGEAAGRIKEHVRKIKQKRGKAPTYMRVDNGRELVNDEIIKFCREEGITIETTAPYSPSQNGVAERFNRTLIELVRAMLIAKGLPTFLWDEAVNHATYIRNRSPTKALKGKTPHEAWTGKKPDVTHFREFGSDVWILDESINRSKLSPKSKKMVFVGFMEGSKSVRYWDKEKRNIKVSRNFTFSENGEMGELQVVELPGLEAEGEDSRNTASQTAPKSHENIQTITTESIPEKPDDTRTLRTRTEINYRQMDNPARRPITRKPKIDELIKEKEVANIAVDQIILEQREYGFLAQDGPTSVNEAINSEEGEKWEKAMEEEIGTLKKMGTWTLKDLPKDRKEIGCKWVFVRKRNEKGEIVQWKARLVAQGFSQKPGTDYNNDGTFAPVMRFETLRTLLAYATVNQLKLRQFDVKGAYLNGYLNETIYMKQPPGFEDDSGRVCLLERSLYGLKQAGNVWNHELNRALQAIGFKQLKTDYCCYIKSSGDDFIILVVWVDDFLSLSTKESLNDNIEQDLNKYFTVKSLGKPNLLLGIKITTESDYISLSQSHYIDFLLDKYGLTDANPVSTPMDPNIKFDQEVREEEGSEGKEDLKIGHGYAQLIGSLMYLALATRPDIAYAVNRLAQFTSNPQAVHWTAVKRIFRYLKQTKNSKLTYGGKDAEINNIDLNFFCDADWGNGSDRKSINGYVVIIAGGAVAWSSKKQQTVALSTAEAEYIAATHLAKQVLWHRSLYSELDFSLPTTSTIFTDNQAAIAISHHPEFHARTKHIDINYHFLRDLISAGTLNTVYINTKDNLADLFTKGLSRSIHQDLTYRIGVLISND
jgi:transposase InsO family protein